MPSLSDKYDVLLEFINDTTETVTVQLLRDYGRAGGGTVLLNSYDSLTLVLESGTAYRYAIKMRTRVVSITCVKCKLLFDERVCLICFISSAPARGGMRSAAYPKYSQARHRRRPTAATQTPVSR
jgi:hypothetical protein